MIINPYRFSGGGGVATGLLADYTGAVAAFSLRQLISTWTGAVVEVRRNGVSPATADFTAAEVADGTLTAWTGANDGRVRTWYDQSGNGFNITQTTNANQPEIVSSGALVTSNGEPAIDFDGTDDYLLNAGNIAYNGGVSWYSVLDLDSTGGTRRIWCDDITGAVGYSNFNSIGAYQLNDNDTGYENISTNTHASVQELSSFHFDSSTGDYEYARGGSNTTGNLSTWSDVAIDSSNTANVGVMGSGNGNQVGDGKMQELIIYPDDQSANRTGIESNINTHYSIY